jgi:hypothetical protein
MAKGGKQPGAGRPKGSLAKHTLEAQEFRKRLIQRVMPVWDDIIDTMIEKAAMGDMRAIEEINNRILGKAIQPLASADNEGNILPFQIVITQTSGNNSGSTVSKAV